MEQIYVLQCEKGKYYVGKTTDVMRRFEEHRSGKGSAWTNKYKPLKLMECKGIVTAHDENNITKDLIRLILVLML
jgi:putative endonuclease